VVPAAEAAVPAEQHFQAGVAAFKAGDFRRAAEHFEAAREAGMASPALLYNLGVSYYRLGRYAKAAAAFRALTDAPANRGLAHYNLGLVALARDDDAGARRHFRQARELAGDDRIRRLAGERLAELRRGERRGSDGRRVSALVSASLGYNDNVTLSPDELVTASDTADHFLEYLAAGTVQLRGDNRNGWQLKGSLLGIDYADINRYDQTYLRAGPEWDHRWGPWDTDLAAYVDWVRLDGELFERIYTAEAEGLRRVTGHTALRLRYRFSRIQAEQPYDYLTGSRHRLAVEGRYRDGWEARYGYRFAYNERKDLSTAAAFTSASPTRHGLFVRAAFPVAAVWELKAGAAFRLSRYHDASTDAATGIRRVREDRRWRLEAGARRDLPWHLVGFARYEHTDNRSNLAEYEYTANTYRLGLERFF
ncbi:MAG TPA: tetratricopeptide repeat protein, partial [Gammaproteobacteria bacterium]|nr:tetratricopeptide repeat protein [Gammaproteobacteria bacterium]